MAKKKSDETLDWCDLIVDPLFRDRPFDVETTERGQIIMTPVNDNHAFFAGEIAFMLRKHLFEGIVQVETPLTTRKGTKSPDVTWCSRSVHEQRKNTVESPIAPEICVEVLSPGNSPEEIEEKVGLYFEQGADEVWICDLKGHLTFYLSKQIKSPQSRLIPEFIKKIDI